MQGDICCGNELIHRQLLAELKKANTAHRGGGEPVAAKG